MDECTGLQNDCMGLADTGGTLGCSAKELRFLEVIELRRIAGALERLVEKLAKVETPV